jgi:serine/threonine-protein kinase
MLVRARDGRDLVKVVDFDIAKGPEGGEEVTRLGFVVGTPEYMSPEQLMGEPLDGRSDVYSLALVLFRMLTGVLPFRAESTQDVMIQRLTHAPLTLEAAAPDIAFPAPLGALLAHALERRPQDRIASAEEFGRALAAALPQAAGAPSAPPPIGSAPRAAAPASAAAPPLAQEVPRTRVSAVPPAAAAAAPAPAPPARGKRGLLAAVIAIVIVGAAGAGWVLLSGDAATVADAGTQTAASPEDADPAPPQTSGGAGQPPATPAGAPPAVDPQRGGGAAAPPRTDPAPGGVADNPRVSVDAGQANAILFQQLELFDLGPPPAHTLQAVIDTAGAVWAMRSLPARDRAPAAYVLGTAYDARSDWNRCWQWVDSALALQPGGAGYADLRNKCRELGR